MATDVFLIWGAGGHARVVADLLMVLGYRVAGFVDRDAQALQRLARSFDITLTEADLLLQLDAGTGYPSGVTAIALGIGSNAGRRTCLSRLDRLSLPALLHPSAVVSQSARVERGAVVLATAVVSVGAHVGEGSIINTGAIVEHDCVLAPAVHVSPGAVLGGGARVGEGSWIGAGAAVVEGITIGRDAIVGAGAVIISDVPDHATVVGNPGRVIKVARSWHDLS